MPTRNRCRTQTANTRFRFRVSRKSFDDPVRISATRNPVLSKTGFLYAPRFLTTAVLLDEGGNGLPCNHRITNGPNIMHANNIGVLRR